jgi:hypothetical protein
MVMVSAKLNDHMNVLVYTGGSKAVEEQRRFHSANTL